MSAFKNSSEISAEKANDESSLSEENHLDEPV
jgi:hypothetical protein